MEGTITTYDLLASQVLGAGLTLTSGPVDLNDRVKNGNLSLEYVITSDGSPTIDVTYELSFDGVNWIAGSSTLADGLTKASGTSGRGVLDITTDIELAPWARFAMTEDASDASGATVSLKLAMQ